MPVRKTNATFLREVRSMGHTLVPQHEYRGGHTHMVFKCTECGNKVSREAKCYKLPCPRCSRRGAYCSPSVTLKQRLYDNAKRATNGCLLWTGRTGHGGYGLIKYKHKSYGTHRLSLWLAKGPPPKDKPFACHACETALCIEPNHLYWGTPKENIEDAVFSGRIAHGVRQGNAKLTDERVQRIRDLYATGRWNERRLATRFGVCFQNIIHIIKFRTWKHV